MVANIQAIFHVFFFFLSTPAGILFKASIEFIIFLLVTYMTISEFLREKNSEHKYLFLAFASLALQRLIIVIVYSYDVFGGLSISDVEFYIPIVIHTLEAFAFILLANAFIYPYRTNRKKIVSTIEMETIALFVISALIGVLWLRELELIPSKQFNGFYGFAVFSTIKATALLYAFFKLLRKKELIRHRHNILTAFLVYAFVPILHILSFLKYGTLNPRIEVFLNPFPFVSVLLFTKVVYLKLVDKAMLKDKLRVSEEKYREAKALGEMRDSFVSVVSHELRTPLTSIKLYTSLLSAGKFGKINHKQKKTIDIINQETDRLTNLIEDILNLSKLESRKESLKISDFNFYEYSRDNPIYQIAREKGIKLKISVPNGYTLRVDAEKFKQVFINLVGNAIKFTDKGGVIIVSANSDKDKWSISIKDTGKGIAKENIPKLFDKFFQIENYMTRDKGGTGLGLAIAKRIVTLHHGDINVESEIGRGSVFTVVIPKAE